MRDIVALAGGGAYLRQCRQIEDGELEIERPNARRPSTRVVEPSDPGDFASKANDPERRRRWQRRRATKCNGVHGGWRTLDHIAEPAKGASEAPYVCHRRGVTARR
jgi:hypothetical protein